MHAGHKWPKTGPQDYQPWKDEILCLFILCLVYKSEFESETETETALFSNNLHNMIIKRIYRLYIL